MRKTISCVIAIVMAFGMLPTFAFASDQPEKTEQINDTTELLEQQNAPEIESNVLPESPEESEDDNQTESLKGKELNPQDYDTESYNIDDYSFKLSQTKFFYNGKEHLPDVICDGLQKGVDYEVEYEQEITNEEVEYYDQDYDEWYTEYVDLERNPTGVGTYKVFIRGIGSYSGEVELPYEIIATSISLNKTSVKLYRKGSFKLKATIKNRNGATTYSSSNAKIATVSSNGQIKAKTKGTATITVKNGYAKKTVKVSVANPKLNASKSTLYVCKTKNLKITGKVGKATFKSSNKRIATVSKAGVITAKKKGKCTITVKTNGMTLKCKVVVKNPSLSKKKLTIYNTDKETLKVIGGKGKIKWKSSNSRVASVTSGGKIKGKRAGTCTITAKRGKYVMKCKVRVPKHYEGYPRIPDFGALYGKTAKKRMYEEDGSTMVYKASKKYMNRYIKQLKKKGYVLYKSEDGVKLYINDYFDLVAVAYNKGLVGIVYTNAWD